MKIGSTTDGQFTFAQVEGPNVPRSVFDRSCGLKTTFDAGYLVPCFLEHVLPGDTVSLKMTSFCRLGSQRRPIMDNMYVEVHFFFVPYRLVWDNAQRFFGERVDPADDNDYMVPIATSPASTGYAAESLMDYFGIPIGIPDLEHMALPARGYNLIWNEHYRATALQDALVVDKDDGPDDPADYVLKRRGKRFDYFTTAQPWPQRGDAVSLGIGSTAPVTADQGSWAVAGSGAPTFTSSGGGAAGAITVNASAPPANLYHAGNTAGSLNWTSTGLSISTGALTWTADLSAATAVTINDLRLAVNLQRILEKDARGGTRYTEILANHFGVQSPDQRLQRPEFLGGGRFPLKVSPVPSTTQLTQSVGDLSAFATAVGSGQGFVKSFVEHGMVIGLVNARADLNYQQGLERHWSKSTRYDFYWPSLAHLGEQDIKVKEIYAQGSLAATDENVWGYNERWSEYRYKPSLTTGHMRSTSPSPLDIWHLAQHFTSEPVLGDTFIQETPPVDRVLWSPSNGQFIMDAYFDFKHVRPIPVYSTPSITDRF